MEPTTLIFRDDAYAAETDARVLAITETGEIVVDRTVFYAESGGQPGDTGALTDGAGHRLAVEGARWLDPQKTIVAHRLGGTGAPPAIGETVTLALDWSRRYARMRAHTCLHLLSVALPFPVTGGSIGDGEGRLDFDLPEMATDKVALTERLNALVATASEVSARWITDAELDANPTLVKTMSVKPPRGSGFIRLVQIGDIDLQPCGGTHVRNTAEIGNAEVTQIEKKGKQNRRVRIKLN